MNCRIPSVPGPQGYNEALLPAAVCRMKQGLGLRESTLKPMARPVRAPILLVRLDPWPKVFLRNLSDLFWPRRQPPLRLVSRPGKFWPDVFVSSRLPWIGFLESALYHALVVACLWGVSYLWTARPQVIAQSTFSHSDVIYYPASEYLPPLNTGGAHGRRTKKGEPEHAPQSIISVPREADNRSQTIVTPPDIKLKHDVPLPNIVAWSQTPSAPLSATARSVAQMKLPTLPTSVVSPSPEVTRTAAQAIPSLPTSVVAPPPTLDAVARQRIGDITIGHQQVVPPAPQLPVPEQRAEAMMARQNLGGGAAMVVPPPPQVQGTGTHDSGGRLIALGIHPVAPTGPIEIPAGNRSGEFAATPQGKHGAAGTPDISGGDQGTDGHSGGGNGSANGAGSGSAKSGIPSGLYVGAGAHPATAAVGGGASGGGTGNSASGSSENSRLLADASPPRVTSAPGKPATEVPEARATELDRKVFGDKKFYSMALNMPNLNSAGGSWVIRFAELKGSEEKGELSAPLAIQKVDPAYPIELMRRNVGGTVSLYAVIHSDGTVGDVRVLRGVDDQLDKYARAALSRWRFRPATKNGNPVAIEAVVMIPFRPVRF
jgi:TonB family protein